MSDATIKWGWYSIDPVDFWGKPVLASHTFASIAGSDGPWFDCYGSHTGPKRKYPVSKGNGSRRLAVTISCFDPDDSRGNSESNFDRKNGGKLGLGDCSGIIYAVSGVCHQMANRIITESGQLVTSAPGYLMGSFITYGAYGSPIGRPDWFWPIYLPACKMLADSSGITPKHTEFSQRVIDSEMEFGVKHADKLYENRMSLVVENRLGKDYSAAKLAKLSKIHLKFIESKLKVDDDYLSNVINSIEHTYRVNDLNRQSFISMHDVLGEKDFEALFGAPAIDHPLINPEIAAQLSGQSLKP
ncbi:MAG: hypothetical protein FIA91_02670 [Geobacter sp.]|nr:hypothetical protein [Geobacter sp.]